MLKYEQLSRKPGAFKSMTGITPDEFQALLTEVRPRHQAIEEQRIANQKRQRMPGGGAKSRHDLTQRLLMTLVWLRLYLTCEAVGVIFGVDKSTVSRHTRPILCILRDLGANTLGWPEEAQALVNPNDLPSDSPDGTTPCTSGDDTPSPLVETQRTDMVAIIDATEQRIERSHHYAVQKDHYSGKKKSHTRKTQIIVNEQGRIRDVSHSVPGSLHDIKLLRHSGALDRLPPEITAMADSGYQGIQDDMPERSVALPYRASRWHPLTPEQKLHNRDISSIRVVVENTIAALKHFKCLTDVFRHQIDRYDNVFLAIVGIVNRRIDVRLARLSAT